MDLRSLAESKRLQFQINSHLLGAHHHQQQVSAPQLGTPDDIAKGQALVKT